MPWLYGNMHQIVDQLEDVLQSLVLNEKMLFITISIISAVICLIIGSIRLSKTVVSGRRMIMMKPSAVATCLTLVACFAGHADASFNYSKGLCLERAYGDSHQCVAKDVQDEQVVVTGTTGPPNCTVGEIIMVDIQTRITSNTDRFDLGAYIGINGSDALTAPGNESCLVQTLGPADGFNNDGRVVQFGQQGNLNDTDSCWDFKKGQGVNGTEIFGFEIKNISVLCNATENNQVGISACFVWEQPGGELNCDNTTCDTPPDPSLHKTCLFPGTPSVSSAPPPHD